MNCHDDFIRAGAGACASSCSGNHLHLRIQHEQRDRPTLWNFSCIDTGHQLCQKGSAQVAVEIQSVDSVVSPMEDHVDDHEMTFNDQAPTCSAVEILGQAATRMGLTPTQMEDLLKSELDVDQLLIYIAAMVSNRMN